MQKLTIQLDTEQAQYLTEALGKDMQIMERIMAKNDPIKGMMAEKEYKKLLGIRNIIRQSMMMGGLNEAIINQED